MSTRLQLVAVVLFCVPLTASGALPPTNGKTAFDAYIAQADPSYSWKLVKTLKGDGYTTFVVDLTSQTWRARPEVDRPVWQHWLTIVKPDVVKHDSAFLRIGGGRNGRAAPDKPDAMLISYATQTHTVAAELGQIPNQPLVFDGDGTPRVEDDLIAYCWVRFLKTGDPTWLPRFPMVKSAVRAMDTITALLGSDAGGKTSVRKFVVAGGSKRGWTTWLTGAVDPRVVAIVPVVIDVVNVRACKINHYSAYGFWAPAIGDYVRHRIHDYMDSPRYAELLRLVDPYFYRDRFTMPKYVVNASGDQYFPPDSSKFYFGDLPGVKYLRYVPNADHSLRGTDALQGILAFYQAVLEDKPLPQFSWKVESDGSLRVHTQTRPQKVTLWQATNPKARDFRLEAIGPAYKQSPLQPESDGVYVARVEKPATGWTAFFVELTFDSGGAQPYKFSTQVHIVPDVLPHSIEELRKAANGSSDKH
jgi:PhoPQ-activated pathogenicity-related protein